LSGSTVAEFARVSPDIRPAKSDSTPIHEVPAAIEAAKLALHYIVDEHEEGVVV
jgi:hypothetical protein